MATLPVNDMQAAKQFYEGTLGLRPAGIDEAGAVIYGSGAARVLVYESEYAGTNRGTAATWVVGDDFDSVVEALRGNGVAFEHYDLPDTTREGDVHAFGDIRAVWFKDPSGNIINVSTGPA